MPGWISEYFGDFYSSFFYKLQQRITNVFPITLPTALKYWKTDFENYTRYLIKIH